MYGSIFCSVTRKPRASRSDPIEAAARPLPNDDTTPPVTKMYFVATSASSRHPVSDLCDLHRAVRDASVQTPVPQLGEHPRDCRPARDPECHDLVAGERDERAVEPEVPVEDGACAAIAHEPEPREHHGCLLAEYARAGARSVRIAQPHDERAPLGEGVTETRERLPGGGPAGPRGGAAAPRAPRTARAGARAPGPGGWPRPGRSRSASRNVRP